MFVLVVRDTLLRIVQFTYVCGLDAHYLKKAHFQDGDRLTLSFRIYVGTHIICIGHSAAQWTSLQNLIRGRLELSWWSKFYIFQIRHCFCLSTDRKQCQLFHSGCIPRLFTDTNASCSQQVDIDNLGSKVIVSFGSMPVSYTHLTLPTTSRV